MKKIILGILLTVLVTNPVQAEDKCWNFLC